MQLLSVPDETLTQFIERIQLVLSQQSSLRPKDPALQQQYLERIKQVILQGRASDFRDLEGALQSSFQLYADPDSRLSYLSRVSTRFDNPLSLLWLMTIWDEVSPFISQISAYYQHTTTRLFLSMVSAESPNARTFIHSPSGVRVIMFNDRMLDFIHEASYVFVAGLKAESLEFTSLEEVPQLVVNHLLDDMHDNAVLEAYLFPFYKRYITKDWSTRPQEVDVLSENARLVAQDIEDAMRYFVIGHEIAHIITNHEGNLLSWGPEDTQRDLDASIHELDRNHEQEYEADYIGFKLGLGSAIGNGISPQVYCWAIQFFFMLHEWIDIYKADLSGHNGHSPEASRRSIQIYDSHPSIQDRLNFMNLTIKGQNLAGHSGMAFDLTLLSQFSQFVRSALK